MAGHGRFLAAQFMGLIEVPVIRLEYLTAAQAKAFMIADNRLTEASVWDDRLLAESLKELSEQESDFGIEATGFTMGEIDLRIEGLSTTGDDEPDMADRLPTPTSQFAVTKSGDIWHLGRHVVLCGSALSEESFRALLGTTRAQMVFADPPYNVPIQGNTSGHGRIQYRDFTMAVGELDAVEFTSFLTRCCALMAKYSIDGSIHFLCMDWRHVAELLEAGRLAYAELKNLCVWDKGSGGLGSFYRSEHELVLGFAALSTKAISRAFFPGARVTVRGAGGVFTAYSLTGFLLRQDSPSISHLGNVRFRAKADMRTGLRYMRTESPRISFGYRKFTTGDSAPKTANKGAVSRNVTTQRLIFRR